MKRRGDMQPLDIAIYFEEAVGSWSFERFSYTLFRGYVLQPR